MEPVTRLFQGLFYFRLLSYSVSDFLSFLRYSSLFSWGFRLTKTLVSFGLLRRMASVITKGTDNVSYDVNARQYSSAKCKEDISPYNKSIRADLSEILWPSYVSW